MLVAPQHPFSAHNNFVDHGSSIVSHSSSHRFQLTIATTPALDTTYSVSLEEKLLASQLAHLASQHHASEYNRLKFGPRGCPAAYIPLSIQSPAQVRVLKEGQAVSAKAKAWWPSDAKTPSLSLHTKIVLRSDSFSLPSLSPSESINLQNELSSAIASPLPAAGSLHLTKTSESHPINISMVVPFEFLPAISAQVTLASSSSPFMFYVPQSYQIDRVTAVPLPGAQSLSSVYRSNGMAHRLPAFKPPPTVWNHSSESDLLKNAIGDENAFAQPRPTRNGTRNQDETERLCNPPFMVPSQSPIPLRDVMTESPPVAVHLELPPSSEPLPLTAAPTGVIRRPRHDRALSAPPSLAQLKGGVQRRNGKSLTRNKSQLDVQQQRSIGAPPGIPTSVVLSSTNAVEIDDASAAPIKSCESRTAALSLSSSLTQNPAYLKDNIFTMPPPSFSSQGYDTYPYYPSPPTTPGLRLGNLYLSSCPGKKVRLSGPVKGRGSICRDLRADLSRVRELGVECIICCLDDAELSYLGASWPEYSSIASDLGLTVLRIPMPEGLAPLTPATLDEHLGRVIQSYTLRGVPVLVHCRGGVGRAGLVACCWMIKLGFCGWKDPELCSRTHGFRIGRNTTCCAASLRIVERAIEVVRRRRSLKAIETYEQVKFLIDYVDYLDEKSLADIGRDVD